MSEQELYDVAIIGAGPGGYAAAFRAADLQLRTVVVERDAAPGGTCLHRGCIPTKVLLHAADLLAESATAGRAGVKIAGAEIDLAALAKQKALVIRSLADGLRQTFQEKGVALLRGRGKIGGANQVHVEGAAGTTTLRAKHLIVATGSEVKELPGLAFDGRQIISSDHALELNALPGAVAILGAGAVGVEFASLFGRLGVTVTLIEMMPQILPFADAEAATEIKAALRRQKIRVLDNTRLVEARVADGKVNVAYRTGGGEPETITVDQLLVAAGRQPNVENLGLEQAGVELSKGAVKVDQWMRTTAPSIYAIGDIVPTPWLAHLAHAEGETAVNHLAGRSDPPVNYDAVPSCVYCDPPLAQVGLTVEQARQRGHEPIAAKYLLSHNGTALILNERRGFVKLVADRESGRLLGAHAVGARATEIIGEAALAITIGARVDDLRHTVHAHPTVYESFGEAAALLAALR